MTKKQTEKADAIARLREWIKPGDTVYTILDHVSASGMSRAIRVVLASVDRRCIVCGASIPNETVCPEHPLSAAVSTVSHSHPNYAVGRALGLRHWKRNGREQDALVIGGCGMDMGFHLVSELSHVLYGGRRCNLHDNGRAPMAGCPFCLGSGYTGGYVCTGKDCPSNTHSQCVACEHGHVQTCHNSGADNVRTCDQFAICQSRVFHSVDTRGTGIVHIDGYALRHKWL